MNQPVNPYVTDASPSERRGFFGRQAVLEWVVRELRDPATNALVLLGQRAIGKTSLLLQLERILPTDAFLPVYFDLQGQATRPLGQVLAGLAGALAKRAGLQSPGPNLFDDQGRFFLHTFLPRFYTIALGESRRPVFLLDEFDVVDEANEAELPRMAAVKALFPFLRHVRGGDPRPIFVFAAGRRREDCGAGLTVLDTSLVQKVEGLGWESAQQLVSQAKANGTLQFSALAVSHILSFTNGHPYLTQLLCQRIWERAYAEQPTEPPLIDTLAVEDAVPDALEAGDRTLAWLWDGLSSAEKIYTAALAKADDEGEIVCKGDVIKVIANHAAWLCTPEVELAPSSLVDWWMLEETEDQESGFATEFFRLWVRQNKPLRVVEDEVGWVAPLAEQLFAEGQGFFTEWQWESAIRCFQNALEEDPRHFRARLGLGEALLELGQINDAVDELARAHELNPAGARPSLDRALAAQAHARDSTSPFLPTDQPAQDLPVDAPAGSDDVSFLSDILPEGQKQDDLDVPTGTVQAVAFHISQWMKRVRRAFGERRLAEVLRLLLPVLVVPMLSALVFYGTGVSLAGVMHSVAWMPPLFDASTFYRFGLVSAILGLFPGLWFSYEFIKQPAFSLELVYHSLFRVVYPFVSVILIYGLLALLGGFSQVSVSEDEWEGFTIFFGWLRKLLER
jgi:tetratricopeptide (TPR) repeat protein